MKSKGTSILKQAERAYKNREFSETIRLLEPQVFVYRQNPKFYFILGMACIHTGDFAGAFSYLKRAEQIEPQNQSIRAAVAIIHLKRYETEQTIRYWLEMLEENPKNPYAKRGLDLLKRHSQPESIEELFDGKKIAKLLPSPGFFVPKSVRKILLGLVVLVFALSTYTLVQRFMRQEPQRPGIAAIQLEEGTTLVDPSLRARYMLTRQEIADTFQRVKDLLLEYRDTEARIEMNRLLLSNATRDVKERVRALLPYIKEPSFLTLPSSASYREVVQDPLLYEGSFVRWKGRITNLRISPQEITFDLLVGYQDQRVLEGVVPVVLNFAANLDTTFAYEILGEVLIKGQDIELRGISIHKLGL